TFYPLLRNKYGDIVGAGIRLSPKNGMIFLLPQFSDKTDLVSDLLQDILPFTHPHLFPEHEGGRWVHSVEYEHPSVMLLRGGVEDIQREADKKKAELVVEIEAERSRLAFL